MALASSVVSCSNWAVENFGLLDLGDKRRSGRVVRFAEALANAPGNSILKLFDSTYDAVAVYDFLSRPEAVPDSLQADHRELVARSLEQQKGIVLLISDTTTMSFSGREIEGLGPVGDIAHGGHGFLVHSMLAARYCDEQDLKPDDKRPALDIIGLAAQTYVVRSPDKDRSKRTVRKDQPHVWTESQLWEEGVRKVELHNSDTCQFYHVGDRENDIYDFYMACRDAEHSFVVRANQNRGLDGQPGIRLFDSLRSQEPAGEFTLEFRARPGSPARQVTLNIAYGHAMLRAPYRKGVQQLGKGEPAEVWTVRLWEELEQKNGIEWILLTDKPVESVSEARQVARIYSSRWLIEEFHKCLKTGLGAERLQLETAHRLQAAVAIFSIVALRLLVMREKVRYDPDAPQDQAGLTPTELAVLKARSKKELKTVKDVVYAVARMGGHFPHNGLPGWQTLWHGMKKLTSLVEGFELAQKSTI